MKRLNRFTAFFAASVSIALATAPAGYALENAQAAPDNAESRSVAALRVGKASAYGNCTGTVLNEHWILSARHCFELEDPSGSKVRVGQGSNTSEYDISGWLFAPVGDIALAYVAEPMKGVSTAKISDKTVKVNDQGRIYGWSHASKLAASGKLPFADVTVTDIFADGENAQSAFLNITTRNGEGVQGGDSGGPLFIDGAVAGVTTAGGASEDINKPAPQAFYSTVGPQKSWIENVIQGNGEGLLQTEYTEPAEGITPKQHGGRANWYGAAAVVLLLLIAGYSRISKPLSKKS